MKMGAEMFESIQGEAKGLPSKVLVSGLINIETTLRVEGFPIQYHPVRYPYWGVNTTISGVGYNVAKALSTLGDQVCLLTLVGQDFAGRHVLQSLQELHLEPRYILPQLGQTPQSVILYDGTGLRQINVDLKDIQEQDYPSELFEQALLECNLAVLCNLNLSRPFLQPARREGKPVATDVHAISDLDDDYNRDFMAAADILFMSHEWLPGPPEEWARQVLNRYGPEILVIGLGAEGALLAVRSDGFLERCPVLYTRPVVNTIGAGDALFSSFVHCYAKTHDPYGSLRRAMVFASYKIGAAGAADGFLDEAGLEAWLKSVSQ
jgi:ribokinase